MVKRCVTIKREQGLHLRPASDLCRMAMQYEKTRIMLRVRDREFNAKSVLGILSACVQRMDEIELVCSGPEEEHAAREIAAYLEQE